MLCFVFLKIQMKSTMIQRSKCSMMKGEYILWVLWMLTVNGKSKNEPAAVKQHQEYDQRWTASG